MQGRESLRRWLKLFDLLTAMWDGCSLFQTDGVMRRSINQAQHELRTTLR